VNKRAREQCCVCVVCDYSTITPIRSGLAVTGLHIHELRRPMSTAAAAGPSTAPSLSALAEPQSRLVDASAMDYFLIEAVQTLRHSSAVADARAKKVEEEMIEAGLIPPPPPTQAKAKKDVQRDSVGAGSSVTSDEEDEGLRTRLEAIGLHVGANITERCGDHIVLQRGAQTDISRLCHGRVGFADSLDVVKFICKDLWSTCWDKQVDNLRTNHRVRFPRSEHFNRPIS
jgi:trafficking protein particle complex subunit 6